VLAAFWGFTGMETPMRLLSSCGLLACLAAPVQAADPAEVQRLAEAFCAAVRASDEAAAEALMSPPLREGIAALRIANEAFLAANPGEKPPLGNGLRLTAYQDYPESCTPEAVTEAGAELLYQPAGATDGAWRDRLAVADGPDGKPVIADILYAPDLAERFSDWLVVTAADGS
jgi:hypothetical protein